MEADIYATCMGSSDMRRRIFGVIVCLFVFGVHLKKHTCTSRRKQNHCKIIRKKDEMEVLLPFINFNSNVISVHQL